MNLMCDCSTLQTAIEKIPEHIQKPLWEDNKLDPSSPWGSYEETSVMI